MSTDFGIARGLKHIAAIALIGSAAALAGCGSDEVQTTSTSLDKPPLAVPQGSLGSSSKKNSPTPATTDATGSDTSGGDTGGGDSSGTDDGTGGAGTGGGDTGGGGGGGDTGGGDSGGAAPGN